MTLMTTQPREMAADKLSRALDELREARSNVSSAERVHATAVENLASARHRLAQAEQAYNNALFDLTGGEIPPSAPPVPSAIQFDPRGVGIAGGPLDPADPPLILRGIPQNEGMDVGSIVGMTTEGIKAYRFDPNGQRTEIPVDGLPIGDVAEWNGR